MHEQEFSAVSVVSVNHVNPRLAEVRQAEQQPQLDLLEIAGVNVVYTGLLLEGIGEHFVLDTKFRGQECVDEGYIVVNAADLEDFFAAEAKLLVPVAPFLQIIALVGLLAEASC